MRTRFIVSDGTMALMDVTSVDIKAKSFCGICPFDSSTRKYWFTITGAIKALKRVKNYNSLAFGDKWHVVNID